jgi:DNA-binding MltR family transcriptional regulator
VFKVSDAEYADFKKRIREVAASMGRNDSTTRIGRDFSLYLLDFMEHGDRALGILVGVALEEASRELLQRYFVEDRQSLKLLQRGNALDSHGARARLAYALGLIPEWLRDDLLTLRDIRVECAHRRAAFFGKNPIAGMIARLNLGKALEESPHLEQSIKLFGSKERARFFLTAGLAWVRLRVWAGILAGEFRCVPLQQIKASELHANRRKKATPSKD